MLRSTVFVLIALSPQLVHACSYGGSLTSCGHSATARWAIRLQRRSRRLVFHPGTGGQVDFRVTFYWPLGSGDAIDLAFGQRVDGVQFKAMTD